MLVISNAFSLNMMDSTINSADVRIERTDVFAVKNSIKHMEFRSVVGHASTAAILSKKLGVNVDTNRVNYTLQKDDTLIVAQYSGPRLEEGATELPEGASIVFWKIDVLMTH